MVVVRRAKVLCPECAGEVVHDVGLAVMAASKFRVKFVSASSGAKAVLGGDIRYLLKPIGEQVND